MFQGFGVLKTREKVVRQANKIMHQGFRWPL